ncbi:hypothetical protein N865_10420 [Intrasporangium oryzae NRRL B-24470]|uniref:Uncharacterized protein n=1 Tax=Intrasporangium oryzae NRRL B-24470 TaxID=1386089 RepID=W9G5L6_9MICO|nr:hypothetical protein [Intrasporangium oryzae]EWT01456.1 hypothetical protein N865_10420 [Intrasporangium oryzae NRRL B-24470]
MNGENNNVTPSHDEQRYQEVSLRAVELLAKAQRAADEAVAEAQSYARDLEKSAREQYKQILQRAQTAAQQVASAEAVRAEQAAPGGTSAVDAQQLAYVRTYARVAHTQLKSVLAALNEELDQLAAMAEASGPAPSVPGLPPTLPEAPSATSPGLATHGIETSPALDPWRPTEEPGSAPQGSSPSAASWPPIATSPTSISYFHRGSGWEGPRS